MAVSMGLSKEDNDDEYAMAVKVFQYPCKVFSVWVFIVCATVVD